MSSTLQQIPDGGVTSPNGFHAGTAKAGIKDGLLEKKDIALLYSEVPATAAAVYTTNLVKAAPLAVTKESLSKGHCQAVVVNSGNANACTGEQGVADAIEMQKLAAESLGVAKDLVAVASTGVIGVTLPMDRVQKGILAAAETLTATGSEFAEAIMTTDLVKKQAAVKMSIGGTTVTVGGAAKGSGMIHPNMATMLAFITTDAAVEQSSLQQALRQITGRTFNRITVDGDTSTNDMAVLLANGVAGNDPLSENHPDWPVFLQALEFVALHLAKTMARDGEGATRLVEVSVAGAVHEADAEKAAKTVVGSSLVKTAVFGADANWGRIMMALGRSGAEVDAAKVDIWIGGVQVAEQGLGLPFDEAAAKRQLEEDPVVIRVNLNIGEGAATAYGCDLTYEYVKINGSYRT
ncbi:bifunctional glutamate N-acetyltransferase/amino-acid acetyltransferase ArgJ [Alicyclobacillus fastidiosus]|uniref:Arginine biosynthesis bifunctional protein ArgJ n=1 Tax=Alicyclobacillus fastidiosus TaxID=392011 RepID=A0ABY6ZCG6_9BACL|nr:bifunctional glutamate N-acetyltransferase/amino-acid acetyltransferase ArgJ [Alicyclobacillus fastidiosus]WAH39951.1 bifunctional glutamate N-acetyltransferase/amino-acid acetyltransferase ArgJ [Alicyclobacillus fastidiosus]GMA61232.1 arginine biosynthesis bifunctional protein ArgJ [Alicyclobacillus fastidiosus]